MNKDKEQQLLQIVKNNYQEIAASFAETRRKPLDEKTAILAASVPNGSRVLDAACGNGRLYSAFAGRPLEYLGFDGSQELINLAAKNYPDAKFLTVDLNEIKNDNRILDDYYDYIFFLAAWQHLPGEERRLQVLKDLQAKVKKGGTIIISNWDLQSYPRLRGRFLKNYFLWLLYI